MKKILKGLLAAALMVSGTASAAKFSNHTYLSMRDTHSQNAQMNSLGGSAASTKKFGATVHVSGFYRQSHNDKDAAAYFGGGSVDDDRDGKIHITKNDGTSLTDFHDAKGLYGYQIDHSPTADTDRNGAMYGTVELAPKRKEVGGQISWHQNLNSTVEGLSFFVNVPMVRVEHELGFKATGTAHADGASAIGQVGSTVAQYLGGTTFTKTAVGAQDALAYGKMDAMKRQVTNVPDVMAGFGYRFINEADYCVDGGLNFVVPVSNKPKGEHIFEPVMGTAGKFAFGANLAGCFNLWKHKTKNMGLDLKLGADYRYTFEGSEHRILGIYNHTTEKLVNAGHYRNLVKVGATSVTPAANVLRREVDVTPGSQFGVNGGFCFTFKKCTLDAGYSLNFRVEESVKIKTANKWYGQYGLAAAEYAASTAGVVGKNAHTVNGPIQAERTKTAGADSDGAALGDRNAATHYVSTIACQTPSQVTHKVGGSLSFGGFKKLPVSLTVGGAFEFDAKNANRSLVSWDAWAKLGFCF